MNGFDIGKAFSFDGRIGRKTYWLMGLLSLGVNLVAYIPFFFALASDNGGLQLVSSLIVIAVYLAVFVASLATTTKRYHDRGKSGWWFLIGLVPLVGPIWMFVELGFLEGQPGENQYGAPSSGSPFAGDAVPATYVAAPSWNAR